jgi:hypothetical protein
LSTFVKLIAALIISILLIAGFIFLTDIKLLDFVEAHFYNPSVVNSYIKENAADAEIVQSNINELRTKFEATMAEPSVRSSFLYNQSPNDIFERSKVYGILMETTAGLQSVQFVDSNGIRLHYSTSSRDIMSQNQNSTAYRNYNENPMSLSYEIVSVQDGALNKLIMDEQNDRIIFSYPFKDSMDVYRGTALFTVSVSTFAERLIAQGHLKVSDNITVIKEPTGILLGVPETSKTSILREVSGIWNDGIQGYVTLDAEDSGTAFSLITVKTDQNLFFGRLVNSYLFSISAPMKLILKVSIFLTFFLTFFFLINLKPNPAIVVRNRVRRLRDSLSEQLYANNSVQERARWILELEQRRDEIYLQLKRGIRLRHRLEANINSIIDKSWDEMLAVLKVNSGHEFTVVHSVKGAVQEAGKQKAVEEVEAIEEVETIDEVEEIEEAEPIEEAEAIDELEEIEEVEGIDELEEIEEVEAIDEIETIEEVEAIGEIEEIEEFESEDVEAIDEVEITEEARTIKTETLEEHKETNIIDIALRAAMEPVEHQYGGLYWLASKFEKKKPASKGLLSLASKKVSAKAAHTGKGLLALAGRHKKSAPVQGKGLLAQASEHEKRALAEGKGLLAHASKIEIKSDDEDQDIIANIDVVSPFSSMFSSLSEKE